MIFVNDSPHFKKFVNCSLTTEFYYTGKFDQSIESIVSCLENGKFPTNLKGNFAFFFKDPHRVVFAVDHLPTYNMFWRDGEVSHIFFDLKRPEDEIDHVIKQQCRMFTGTTVGNRTTIKNISRLEAGTYFEKNLITGKERIEEYIDLYTHYVDKNITINDFSEIVEQVVEENTREPFNLFWSSGTDSNSIYGFIRKLKRTDRCNLISLYSDQSSSDERAQIEQLEKEYGVKTTYVNLGKFVGLTENVMERFFNPSYDPMYKKNYERIWRGFWWDPNVFQKYLALYDLGISKEKTLTGEAGDQIFGSRYGKTFLSVITQRPDIKSNELASIFLSSDAFNHRKKFFKWTKHWDYYVNEYNPYNREAWDVASSWLEKTWDRIDTGDDIINKSELLLHKFKASARCYGYSQFFECDFVHPFADYRVYHTVFKLPGSWKTINGRTRRLSQSIIKDHASPNPWSWPKSGIEIPMYQGSFRKK
jgi:hypothetical protein